jgi:hypothetical protein
MKTNSIIMSWALFGLVVVILAVLAVIVIIPGFLAGPANPSPRYLVGVSVKPESGRPANAPCELEVDFSRSLNELGEAGEFDPCSVAVEGKNLETGRFDQLDHRLSEHYKYGRSGKVSWLIPAPDMTEFRILFDTASDPPRKPPAHVPAIGIGDEILFNTDEPAPLVAMSAPMLGDFNADGITDVLAINHYSDRFGWPYDGILFHPGIREDGDGILIRDFYRLHFIQEGGIESDLRPLHARYNWVCPTDWDGDGRSDILYISMAQMESGPQAIPENAGVFPSASFVTVLLNTGEKLGGGLPVLKEAGRYPAEELTRDAYVPSIACEDLDGDGRRDLIGVRTSADGGVRAVSVYFFKNTGGSVRSLPELDPPHLLRVTDGRPLLATQNAHLVSFGDVNLDGRIDIIGNDFSPTQTYWFENAGGSPPLFKEKRLIAGLPETRRGFRWARWGKGEGLLGQAGSRLLRRVAADGGFILEPAGHIREAAGPLRGGSQEKPEWVDWDADGDMDLLAGEFSGQIHLYKNVGTKLRPSFRTPVWVEAEGRPLRIYRDGVFGGKHWHGMAGYPSVACMDWDRDGLFDLIVPNETNRVFWFKNIGRQGRPKFGERRQILPDGFSDSAEKLERTRRLAEDWHVPNHPYPFEDDIPFFWRTRVAIADYTGDGLEDLIALDGKKDLVLYERYKDNTAELRLRSGKQLHDETGAPIRQPHYFKLRNVDWDRDGRVDIVATQNLFGADQRSLLFLKNVGTPEWPVFAAPKALQLWGKDIRYSSHGLQPSFVDYEGDGNLDFIGCNESGFFILIRYAALIQPKPETTAGKPGKR